LENTAPWRRKIREGEYGSLEHDRELLKSLSPMNVIEQVEAPLLVIHGANDPRIPLAEAEQIVRELKNRNRTAELIVYPDEGHGLGKFKNRMHAYERVSVFLDMHLRGVSPDA
jgi:dipeptidyl aminopeptidase/acylaminoacyl peptidase